MTDIRRVSLFSKLNPMLYKALETATAFAKLRGNAYVELVHCCLLYTSDAADE